MASWQSRQFEPVSDPHPGSTEVAYPHGVNGLAIMRQLRNLCLVVLTAAVIGGSIAAPAYADDTGGTPIAYSETYRKLIAAYPSGSADPCDAWAVLHPGDRVVCDGRIDMSYFYPDGTWGPRPWYVDPASPKGWSVPADPCIGLTDDEQLLWAWYVDYVNGYYETGPTLTGQQIDQYGACWGWWL